MAELRREWTPEEAADRAPESRESLPEAVPTHRRAPDGRAGGADHSAGEEQYNDPVTGGAERLVPPDPPRNIDAS